MDGGRVSGNDIERDERLAAAFQDVVPRPTQTADKLARKPL